jgi:GT2 family glycosyltransferase
MTNVSDGDMSSRGVTVSLVSHGHGQMVSDVLASLARIPEIAHVVLTLNVPEQMSVLPAGLHGKLTVIENPRPQGFGANHNSAFTHCKTSFFCVLNPDIRFDSNPFPALLGAMATGVGLVAPLVINSAGVIEDSVRFFPTPLRLLKKALGISRGVYFANQDGSVLTPEWVAGMCMLFDADAYRALAGFDEGYFLYYEDVDICARAWKTGLRVVVCQNAVVIHDAQRESHRSFKFLRWHVASMLRFCRKHIGRLPNTTVNN